MTAFSIRPAFVQERVKEWLTAELCVVQVAGARRARSPEPASAVEADARTRTGDPIITSDVLYQLSYVGAASMVPARDGCVPSQSDAE